MAAEAPVTSNTSSATSIVWRCFDRVLNILALIAAAVIPFMFLAIIYDVTTRNQCQNI